jgi:O-antigen ligase
VLIASTFQDRNQIRRTLQGMLLAATVAAVYGLAQFGLHYYQLQRQGLPFYENYVVHQITGFMSHWMTFGGQLMLMLFLLSGVLLFGEQNRAKRWGWLGAVLMGAALLAAFTRGIWLGTLAGLAYLVGSHRRWMLWLIPTAVLTVYLISPVWLQRRGDSIFQLEGDSSSLSRLVMVRTGLRMVAAHPWFGLGPERVAVEFARYNPQGPDLPAAWYGHLHNSFLQIAAERGIPCLIILLWFLFEVLRDNLSRSRKALPNERALRVTAVAATIGMTVSGLFEYNFGDSEVLTLYLILISVPFAWQRTERKQSAEAPPAVD